MEASVITLLEIVQHIARKHPEVKDHLGDFCLAGMNDWRRRNFGVPCPREVKDAVLLRNGLPDATWVETGTYLGDTTALLSTVARRVITIEPEPVLYQKAKQRFADAANITLLNDISENTFPKELPQLSGNVCFWLDGHYSAGETFKGPNDTPLLEELACVAQNLHRFSQCVVLIDDIRLCGHRHIYGEYPSLDYLVDWARQHRLSWHIEFDIFVARTA